MIALIHLLNTVDNDQLFVTRTVTLILIFILGSAAILNAGFTVRAKSVSGKLARGSATLCLFALMYPAWQRYLLESQLLHNAEYVEGTTVAFCNEFAKGKGILFEYNYHGKTYRACNTPHPVPINQIKVPGGQYNVRVTPSFPDEGRMVFRKP